MNAYQFCESNTTFEIPTYIVDYKDTKNCKEFVPFGEFTWYGKIFKTFVIIAEIVIKTPSMIITNYEKFEEIKKSFGFDNSNVNWDVIKNHKDFNECIGEGFTERKEYYFVETFFEEDAKEIFEKFQQTKQYKQGEVKVFVNDNVANTNIMPKMCDWNNMIKFI